MGEMTRGVEMAKRPEKTSFSVTCSLLSQYIKEKCSLADLGLGLSTLAVDSAVLGKVETDRRLQTTMDLISGVDVKDEAKPMELFPQITGFGPMKADAKLPENSQLTIFYDGKMFVFGDFPDEKAKDLMQLASKCQNSTSGASTAASTIASVPVTANARPPASFPSRARPNFSELPIARKASLHRFLEKRKDRISAKTPYPVSSSNGSKHGVAVNVEEIGRPWLDLGPHISNPGLNSNCTR